MAKYVCTSSINLCVFTLSRYFTAWDLLCIDVYGFKAFCDLLPGYFASPLRISGSAVESIFSQYRRIAVGTLDSVIYSTSRCAHLVLHMVKTYLHDL